MFTSLSQKLTGVFDGLRRRGTLSDADVDTALREIRIALLEADVALPVLKEFIAKVREKASGAAIVKSIQPGQMVVKIVSDALVELLGAEAVPLNLAAQPPAVILMAGLQGSGKTTTSGKLAKYLTERQRKKVLLASLDIYRPAAQEQLRQVAAQIKVECLPIIAGEKPEAITRRALDTARLQAFDVLILDTAGRLHIDESLMAEIKAVHALSNPVETLLVADAMTGQDAVNVAKAFRDALPITGIVLTRMDSDARGGAALSMRQVTGAPIKFLGVSERPDGLEEFHPQRVADRILGMGDIVSLVEKAAANIDQAEAEKMAAKMQKGQFDLDDLLSQLRQMKKMGGISSMLSFLPGMSAMKDKIPGDAELQFKRQEAIILSMTPGERRNPKLLQASRKRRVAAGAGVDVPAVNRLLKQYEQMADMMKKFGKMSKKDLMRGGMKGLFGGQ
ncbi:MAG: signal recognition particle protein [Alphaproteobacteria bacterium]|nr:signal recognition particle protein [Alphaproteobacteria bacterium]